MSERLAQALAPFRGAGAFRQEMLQRSGMPLALAEISIPDDAHVIDLDDPAVLLDTGLRPSRVATARREVTQADAARLFAGEPPPLALRWWSTLEASLANLTVFDRAREEMEVLYVAPPSDAIVCEAAELVGLAW